MPEVGIFWVYDGSVVGVRRSLESAEEGVSGLLDSPDSHVDSWPSVAAENGRAAECEYDDVPRGRVLYDSEQERSIVYLDACLDKVATRKAIAQFFDLDMARTDWEHDSHYTTNARQRFQEYGE